MAWATIGKTCFESNDQMSDNDFMESATSALRAITQKLQDSNAGGFLLMNVGIRYFSYVSNDYFGKPFAIPSD